MPGIRIILFIKYWLYRLYFWLYFWLHFWLYVSTLIIRIILLIILLIILIALWLYWLYFLGIYWLYWLYQCNPITYKQYNQKYNPYNQSIICIIRYNAHHLPHNHACLQLLSRLLVMSCLFDHLWPRHWKSNKTSTLILQIIDDTDYFFEKYNPYNQWFPWKV